MRGSVAGALLTMVMVALAGGTKLEAGTRRKIVRTRCWIARRVPHNRPQTVGSVGKAGGVEEGRVRSGRDRSAKVRTIALELHAGHTDVIGSAARDSDRA